MIASATSRSRVRSRRTRSMSPMPFKTIACHVWAIDGYVDDSTAETVNNIYNETANSLKPSADMTTKFQNLAVLIQLCRQSKLTDESATVYGGFRVKQNAPEHMWLEYNGKIYETMPGEELVVDDATPKTRVTPKLENSPFEKSRVAVISTKLTVNQKNYINSLKEEKKVD
jgi:hypothetical protein